MDAKKHKTPAHVNVALGVEVDLSKTHNDGVVAFRATRDRCQKILQLWDDARQANNRPQGPTRIRLGFWFTKSKHKMKSERREYEEQPSWDRNSGTRYVWYDE